MGLGGFARYALLRKELLLLITRAIFFGFCFLLELIFTQKTNEQHTRHSLLQSINAPPPQVHHELTCCHNCRGDEGEEADQAKDLGGVSY